MVVVVFLFSNVSFVVDYILEYKMEGPMSKKIKEPPKGVNHKRNIKFLNPFLLQNAYEIRKWEDLLKGCLTWKNLHLLQ
jgi:hypothetical protein